MSEMPREEKLRRLRHALKKLSRCRCDISKARWHHEATILARDFADDTEAFLERFRRTNGIDFQYG